MIDEKVVGMTSSGDGDVFCWTNHGRMFEWQYLDGDRAWEEMTLPDLKKSKPRQAKESGYTEDFEELWSIYPKGNKGSKQAAFRSYQARINENFSYPTHQEIEIGILNYKDYIKATGQYMQHMSTFLGRDKHYLNDYTIPEQAKRQNRVKQEWETIPENENAWLSFIEKHGFKKPDRMATIFETKQSLQRQIKQRIEDEINRG